MVEEVDEAALAELSPAERSGLTRRRRTRAAAIEAAAEQFEAAPYHEVSVAQIAAASGLGLATLYGVFGHKSVLAVAAFESVVLEGWAEVGGEGGGCERAWSLLRGLSVRAARSPGLARAYHRAHADGFDTPAARERLDAVRSAMVGPVHRALSSAAADGQFVTGGQRRLVADVMVDAILRAAGELVPDEVSTAVEELGELFGLTTRSNTVA